MSEKKSINNKVLTFVLLLGIASTGFAWISAANSGQTLSEKSNWMQQWVQKIFHGGENFGKRKGFGNLSEEEKTALEAMSDEEKKAFFEAKKAQMIAQKEAGKAVIDKLLAGESLTAAEEAIRGEMLMKIEEDDTPRRDGGDIIAKLLAGDALTDEEQTQLAEMQAKHAEREAQRAILEPIKEKLKVGEELTDEEQTILDEAKANKPEGKMGGKWKGKGHRGGERANHHDDFEDDIETDEEM